MDLYHPYHTITIDQVRPKLEEGRLRSLSLLRQAIKGLKERSEYVAFTTSEQTAPIKPTVTWSRKIFVVHGHDDASREAIASFLRKADFEPVILQEQANRGLTVIEKLIANGEVGFSVVLLTPDDEGGAKGQSLEPRARQNVLLELGYFLGRLGRERVCAMKRGAVEIPSDWQGVVNTEFDAHGGWKTALLRELQAVDYEVDWRKALS